MTNLQAGVTIAVIAGVTLLTRALPFLLFPPHRGTPSWVVYLGRVLPFAVMGMLVVYCLKSVDFFHSPFGAPEGIAVLAVALLYLWRRSTLLPIVGGTALYMVLLRLL